VTPTLRRGAALAPSDPSPEDAAGPDPADRPPDRPGEERSRIPWWPILVPLVVVLVGAWLYRWVDEDAFINFRIIDNLLAGHGFVFNVGERVEVDSDPLWVLTLAGLHEVVPFLAIEWLSVVVGLVCTAGGFVTGGRAIQRLAAPRTEATVFPLGLLMVSVVAGVWEFSTSGLEMSMVFLWLGSSFLLLVRVAARRRRAVPAAVVIGLGPLIRPELSLGAAVFLLALLAVVAAPGWAGPGGRFRRFVLPVVAALALPVVFEVFRMGYYAMIEPNTGLAKAGGAAWWSQGFTYLWNFVSPYTLWLPLVLAVPFVVAPARSWWSRGDRVGVVVLLTPVVVAAADVVYVVHVGGDYMHARLLLPGFFALCLPVFVTRRQLRGALAVPAAVIAVWAVVCGGWLRYVPPKVTSLDPRTVFISNERNNWISATGNPHPVTAADYARALSGQVGPLLRRMAHQVPAGQQRMLVVTDPYAPIDPRATVPARSGLPFRLVVNVPAIGVIGYLAGPDVYLFDSYSLANPIGSHTVIVHHARPGHEKFIGPSWMVARFGVPGRPLPTGAGQPGAVSVAAARRALGCEPLAGYLHAITAPLTVSRFVSDLAHSFTDTTLSFSADPLRAADELCDGGSPAAGSLPSSHPTAPTAPTAPTPS
jgi:arabinofuranosyltransferase